MTVDSDSIDDINSNLNTKSVDIIDSSSLDGESGKQNFNDSNISIGGSEENNEDQIGGNSKISKDADSKNESQVSESIKDSSKENLVSKEQENKIINDKNDNSNSNEMIKQENSNKEIKDKVNLKEDKITSAKNDKNKNNKQLNNENGDWVSRHKLDLLSQQAERTKLLQDQKQLILAESEQNTSNLNKCHDRYKLLLERLTNGHKTSKELSDYLTKRQKYYKNVRSDNEMDSTCFASLETGTIRQTAISQDHFHVNSAELYREMNERVFNPVLNRLENFVKSTDNKSSVLKAEGSRISKHLRDKKQHLDKTQNNYESLMTKSVKLASQGKPLETDPFLAARQYQLAAAGYKASEAEYCTSMSKFFNEVTTSDGRRIDEIKAILLDQFLAEKTLAINQIKLIDTVLMYIKAIDREKDVAEFVKKGDFIVNASNGETVFENISKLFGQNTLNSLSNSFYRDIIKHGTLFRQGRIISSNQKPMFVVLTRSGFVHCYNTRKDVDPFLSLTLVNVNISLRPDIGEQVFEIAVPNMNIFTLSGSPTRHIFKSDTEENMVEQICELNKHLQH